MEGEGTEGGREQREIEGGGEGQRHNQRRTETTLAHSPSPVLRKLAEPLFTSWAPELVPVRRGDFDEPSRVSRMVELVGLLMVDSWAMA